MANITTAQFATELGTDGRTVRKFLRSITPKDEQPGKGSRWEIDGSKRSINTMKKNFDKWNAAQLEAKAKKAAQDAEVAAEVVEVEDAIELDD